MNYQMEVEGMHCGSCKNLITMELEDREFTNVKVDPLGSLAKFSSDKILREVADTVKIMEENLGKYQFLNIREI